MGTVEAKADGWTHYYRTEIQNPEVKEVIKSKVGPIIVMNGKTGAATRAPQSPKGYGDGYWNTVFTEAKNMGRQQEYCLIYVLFLSQGYMVRKPRAASLVKS